ncbi:MAG TPA: hypothetical protein VL326_00155 [Kofleriaceae bacterium]|jgi:hypothetical protein|nr:hypothetical protein [Kofleriaceae bacterium]
MPRPAIPPTSYKLVSLCGIATCALTPACKRHVDPGPDLQITTDGVHLRSTDPIPRTSPIFDGTRVTLEAARGETVGFLVYQRAPAPVKVDTALPATLYEVDRVTAKRGSTALYGGGRGAGSYPDVLRESTSSTTNPTYVELTVPPDAVVGERGATLFVGSRTIDVKLTVHDVTLPALSPRVWAYYDPRELVWAKLGNGTHDAPSAEEKSCIATFRRYGVMLSPDLSLSAWPARRELLAGFPFIPVKLDADHVTDDVRGWIAATKDSGQLPFTIPIDEPRKPDARAKVRALSQQVREAGGGPSTFLYAVTAEPHPELGDAIDLYITLTPKRADTFPRWTYNGAPPRAGSFVLDALPPGSRTWGWLAWQFKLPVWYVWDALYWHDRHNRKGAPLPGRALDATTDAISFDDGEDHGNLDGVLALPGDAATPCRPTLRLAAIRRGQQDRALLELAEKCHPAETKALVDKLIPRALGEASQHGSPEWPTDDAAWDAARVKLLDLAACH